jgi:hypothetical protein
MKRVNLQNGSSEVVQKTELAQLISDKAVRRDERFAPRGRAFVSHADFKALVKFSGIHINQGELAKDTPATGNH